MVSSSSHHCASQPSMASTARGLLTTHRLLSALARDLVHFCEALAMHKFLAPTSFDPGTHCLDLLHLCLRCSRIDVLVLQQEGVGQVASPRWKTGCVCEPGLSPVE